MGPQQAVVALLEALWLWCECLSAPQGSPALGLGSGRLVWGWDSWFLALSELGECTLGGTAQDPSPACPLGEASRELSLPFTPTVAWPLRVTWDLLLYRSSVRSL